MEWSWTIFFIALPIFILFSMFSRGYMNQKNIVKYGSKADYRASPKMAIFGSIVGGAVHAAIITIIIGFF